MSDDRGYQTDFSATNPYLFESSNRKKKADTIISILTEEHGSLAQARVLNVGGGAGAIDDPIAPHVREIYSLDIDFESIHFSAANHRQANLFSLVADGMKLPFPDNAFDIVLCTHVYEHVPIAERLMEEIFRVMAQQGCCYFSAGNRLQVMEPHYRLPFLSVIPRALAHPYMRITGKGQYYYEKHLTLSGLRKLVSQFKVTDYTQRMIEDPKKYKVEYMVPDGSAKQRVAVFLCQYLKPLFPSYIWILRKSH